MRRKGFTLVELLVVISIMSLLMAIMMPVLGRAKQQGRNICCLSNLRQMVIAANLYSQTNDDHFPMAYTQTKFDWAKKLTVESCWDFATMMDWSVNPPETKVENGLLWGKDGVDNIQQCPEFKGTSNTASDPYTGYNYNTSYIGYDEKGSPPNSAKVTMVRNPGSTALFGDGQYGNGANKFMRAPWSNSRDKSFAGRYAGTQGFRHMGRTNVAFCDGHAKSWGECFKETYDEDKDKIAEGTGFLSEDNSLYDID